LDTNDEEEISTEDSNPKVLSKLETCVHSSKKLDYSSSAKIVAEQRDQQIEARSYWIASQKNITVTTKKKFGLGSENFITYGTDATKYFTDPYRISDGKFDNVKMKDLFKVVVVQIIQRKSLSCLLGQNVEMIEFDEMFLYFLKTGEVMKILFEKFVYYKEIEELQWIKYLIQTSE
jgi:hypothetical protein